MDRRGLTTDPNADVAGKWWANLGPTQKPSPYATASWRYLQDYQVDVIEVPTTPTVVYDNGNVFSEYNQPIDWDGGLFNPPTPPETVLDGGGFNSNGQIVIFDKITFATVYVYDLAASYPDVRGLDKVILDTGDLATDPNAEVILTESGFSFYSEVPAQTVNDTPPGTCLGTLSYTIDNERVDIQSWEHYNWQDASPVKQAFRAMVRSLPECVESVHVKDSPTAFWVDLGFRYVNKGDTELKYQPVTYRGY
jgi:hypothetical protein